MVRSLVKILNVKNGSEKNFENRLSVKKDSVRDKFMVFFLSLGFTGCFLLYVVPVSSMSF